MAGLRSRFRWNSTGINDRTDSAIFLERVRAFSGVVSAFLHDLGSIEIIQGQRLSSQVTTATAALQYFPHGLGRDYHGAIIIAQNQRSVKLTIALPSDVRAAGHDPSTVFGVEPGSATAVTFNVWVF